MLIIFSCSCNSRNKTNGNLEINSDSASNLYKYRSEKNEIEYWGDITYFDSSLVNKKIYKYSHDGYGSYACILAFDKPEMDSLDMIGYHERYKERLLRINDSTFRFSDYDKQYSLISIEGNLISNRMVNNNDTSSKCYYRLISKDLIDLQKYFAKNLISGKYKDIESDNIIRFQDDLTISGIDSVKSYKILLDFQEMVPQMDIIYFIDENKKYVAQLHWWFDNDTLLLQEAYDAHETDTGWVDGGVTGKIFKYELIK